MTNPNSLLDRFLGGLIRFRSLVIFFIIISTLFFGYFLSKIHVDNDPFKAIPPNLQAKIDYDNLKKEFSAPYFILFIAEFKAGNLTEKIDSLNSWSSAFASLDGISGVTNLNTLQVPVKGGFFGVSSDYVVSKKDNNEELTRRRIQENREFSKIFISDDETVLGMVIGLKPDADRSIVMKNVLNKTNSINQNPNIKTYFTSEAAVSYFIDKAMKKDFAILLPVCFLIVFLLLYRVFRRVLYVCAALLVNVIALVWTFGLMGMLNVTFSVVTSVIPVILFPIGVAGAIHIIKAYTRLRRDADIIPAIQMTYKEQLLPCFLAAVTTFAGFASFVFSEISWTRTFGLYTGVSVMFAFAFNITMIPVFLSFEKKGKAAAVPQTSDEVKLNSFWDLFSRFTLESRKWVWLFPVLLILFYVGFRMVKVESNPIAMLPENNMLRVSDNFIGKYFGGTRFFSVVLENKGEKISSIEQWKAVQDITGFIEKQEGIGNVASVLPLMSKVSTMLTGDSLSKPAVMLLTSKSGMFGKNFSSFISGFLSESRQKTRLNVTCRSDEQTKPLIIAENIKKYVQEKHKDWSVLISGPAILNESMSSVLIDTQISSLISTFIPVFLCLILFFKSPRIGIFALIPIIFSTAFVYSIVGVLGVTINLVTVIIMNTCVGIGIDYAIHLASGFIFQYKITGDKIESLKAAIKIKGTPILFNTLVVGIGFLVLAFSSFPPIRDFGILVFVSMIVSAGFSMLFLPLLLLFFGIGKPALSERK